MVFTHLSLARLASKSNEGALAALAFYSRPPDALATLAFCTCRTLSEQMQRRSASASAFGESETNDEAQRRSASASALDRANNHASTNAQVLWYQPPIRSRECLLRKRTCNRRTSLSYGDGGRLRVPRRHWGLPMPRPAPLAWNTRGRVTGPVNKHGEKVVGGGRGRERRGR